MIQIQESIFMSQFFLPCVYSGSWENCLGRIISSHEQHLFYCSKVSITHLLTWVIWPCLGLMIQFLWIVLFIGVTVTQLFLLAQLFPCCSPCPCLSPHLWSFPFRLIWVVEGSEIGSDLCYGSLCLKNTDAYNLWKKWMNKVPLLSRKPA